VHLHRRALLPKLRLPDYHGKKTRVTELLTSILSHSAWHTGRPGPETPRAWIR